MPADREQQGRVEQQKRPRGSQEIQCIAHHRSGRRCTAICEKQRFNVLPYCAKHLESGDDAVMVKSHPLCGKILVARFDLPKGYRIIYHGTRRSLRSKEYEELDDDEDRTIWFYPGGKNTARVNGYLDPTDCPGSVMQFAGCIGPGELTNCKQTNKCFGRRNGDYGGIEYITTMPVPAGTQLVHWYGSEWWKCRPEIKRMDVGTEEYPAPRRVCSKRRRIE